MKLVLEKVKIYGFDPSICRVFTNDGVEKRDYSVGLYISGEQKALIDSYIFDKVAITKDGEFLFYGKNKQPIPVFDIAKNRIENPINEVFMADVSILIDEFQPKDKEYPVRYSKCLGIKYLSPVANETPRIVVQEKYETFDQIFSEEEQKDIFAAVTKTEPMIPVDCSQGTSAPGYDSQQQNPGYLLPNDDLPF